MSSGASTMPMKIVAAEPSPTAPPMPISLRKPNAKPFTITGRMRQCQSSAASAEITMTSGNMPNAKLTMPVGLVTTKGGGPPPMKPKTKDVPALVAPVSASTAPLSAAAPRAPPAPSAAAARERPAAAAPRSPCATETRAGPPTAPTPPPRSRRCPARIGGAEASVLVVAQIGREAGRVLRRDVVDAPGAVDDDEREARVLDVAEDLERHIGRGRAGAGHRHLERHHLDRVIVLTVADGIAVDRADLAFRHVVVALEQLEHRRVDDALGVGIVERHRLAVRLVRGIEPAQELLRRHGRRRGKGRRSGQKQQRRNDKSHLHVIPLKWMGDHTQIPRADSPAR